jgi:SURF4 family
VYALMETSRYLPAIGRFLIVVTFLEDALRILTQWSDQLVYLKDFRHSSSALRSVYHEYANILQSHGV